MMTKNILWENIRTKSKKVERSMDSLRRKRTGSYYTSLDLTDAMMHELVELLIKDNRDIAHLSFLEPCAGIGNFVFSYLKELYSLSLSKIEYMSVLNGIYVADVNKDALDEYKRLLNEFVNEYFQIELSDKYFETHIGNGLLIDVLNVSDKITRIEDVFPLDVIKDGFDIVVTNPPYKNLKAERSQYNTAYEYEKDQLRYASISKVICKELKFSTDGVLNLYKLFVEEIVDRYASKNGYVSLLVPSTILSDKTCRRLRTHLFLDYDLISVKAIGEGSGFIDAQQALTTLLLKKDGKTKSVEVTKDFYLHPEQKTSISIDDIMNADTGNALFTLNSQEYAMLKKLREFPVLSSLKFISNLRGELDLTSNKDAITTEKTTHPLIRGRDIKYYKTVRSDTGEYVKKDFIEKSTKRKYIEADRIICQQVVNMQKERRVTFAYCKAGNVLGNSCNFIYVEDNPYKIDIFTLMGLFNSSIINWFFKLTSSNNHVNNYEIACFPIPIKSPLLRKIGQKVQEYLASGNKDILNQIENFAYCAYGLNEDNKVENIKKIEDYNLMSKCVKKYYSDIRNILPEITYDEAKDVLKGTASIDAIVLKERTNLSKLNRNVINGITEKYKKLYHCEILNHETFKLSELDLEMIKSVPQGGNWKDIPEETVNKSKRLKRITETGGRTTLYGRIDYKKPSYTITTYFNRPGNGTYVHPIHERVLSVREAARFQSFPDDYYFFGNKKQVLNQVGNAVPTILAYQIGNEIVKKTGCERSIDLFCGAGGMTAGFKAAGIKSQLSNDIEESACITLKINNPEINIYTGDITLKETKDYIVDIANKTKADIICGGPPCQGFSLAGFRLTNDPRNKLFKEYVEIVRRVNPKIIVFENVEGLLSYQKGNVYKAVLQMFRNCGYNTEGRTLMATHYAVPQKRKRVIIICTRKDQVYTPSDLFPRAITLDDKYQVNARDTIGDLENVPCNVCAKYDKAKPESKIVQLFKGKIDYFEYVKANTHAEPRAYYKGVNSGKQNM